MKLDIETKIDSEPKKVFTFSEMKRANGVYRVLDKYMWDERFVVYDVICLVVAHGSFELMDDSWAEFLFEQVDEVITLKFRN